MDNNSTFVPGMKSGLASSSPESFNPYAQPSAGGGTYIPGMQAKSPAFEPAPATSQSVGTPVVGFLYSISNGGNREFWPIHVGTNIIGRDANADIRLMEATVSGRHAEIRVRELRTGSGLTATIQDLGSKTGILVNETDPGYDLIKCGNGDMLTIGENYQLLAIFIDTTAAGLSVAEGFMPVAEEKENATIEVPVNINRGGNPYDRNSRGTQSGTVDLSGANSMDAPGGTMILE